MPRIPINDEDEAEVDYDLFGRIVQALQQAGVTEDADRAAATIVKATTDDGFRDRMIRAVQSGQLPRGVAGVFQQLASGRLNAQPAAPAGQPAASTGLLGMGQSPATAPNFLGRGY